jgi:hypothetical protein
LKGAAKVTAQIEVASETAMTSGEPILAAINRLQDSMNNNHETTYNVLQDINSSVKKIAIRKSESGSGPQETTELTSALESSAGAAPASPQMQQTATAWSGNNWSPQ